MTTESPFPSLRLSVVVLLVAALVGALASWFGTAWLSPASVRATADVNIAPLVGTYSNYEVATHAADFASSYDGGQSGGDGGSDPDSPGAFVDSSRLGDGTIIRVTYVGESAEEAEAGLRRHVLEALDTVAEGLEQQMDATFDGAEVARESLQEDDRGTDDAAITRSGEIVADARAALQRVEVAKQRNDRRAASLDVDIEELTSTGVRLRAAATTALTALLLAGGALFLLRRRSLPYRPRRAPRPIDDVPSP